MQSKRFHESRYQGKSDKLRVGRPTGLVNDQFSKTTSMRKSRRLDASRPHSTLKICLRNYVGDFLKKRKFRGPYYKKMRLDFPLAMCLNVHTYCNQACIMCPHEEFYKKRSHGIMDFGLYKRLLDEFAHMGGKIMTFNNFSEIFAHQEGIRYVLKALDYKNLKTYIVSNGLNLVPETADCLFKSGFEGVFYISCHSFSEESFKKISGRSGFDRVKDNIEYIAQKHRFPERIVIQFINDFSSDEEVKEAKRYWNRLGVTLNEMSSHTFCDESHHKRYYGQQRGRLIGCNSWGHDAGLPFYQIVIQHNGDVTLCCMDVTNRIIIGNVKDSSIKSVWNSKEFLEIIDIIYSGITSANNNFICNTCPSALYDFQLSEPKFVEILKASVFNAVSKVL